MKKIKLFFLAVVLAVAGITSSYAQSTVKDIDGNVYNTVKIGNQLWLKENLKVTKFNDGSPIPNISKKTVYGTTDRTGAWYWDYADNPENNKRYGKLYNWSAVISGKLCPKGWHIPSKEEWEELVGFIGKTNAACAEMQNTDGWLESNVKGTNKTGFSALPGGYRTNMGGYTLIGYHAEFWSTSYSNARESGTYTFTVRSNTIGLGGNENNSEAAVSCRCIADNPNTVANVKQEKTVTPTAAICEAKDAFMKYKASMISGDRLSENEKLISVNGRYQLRVTTDGNFVIEEILNDTQCQFKEIFRFPLTNGGSKPKKSFFSFNPDGNVCMDSKQGKTYCATTGRDAKAAAILSKEMKLLELTNTGKLRLVNGNGKQIWSAN